MVGGSGNDFVMARYKTDGSLDETFGAGGLVMTDIAGGADTAFGARCCARPHRRGRAARVGSQR